MKTLKLLHPKLMWLMALICSGNLYGHVNYPCLVEVERLAKDLKRCTSANHQDHCRDARQALSDQVRQCQQQAFTADALEEAIREGESQVAGGRSYYLPKEEGDTSAAEVDISKGNIHNFRRQFANVNAFPVEDLDYGAGQGGCHSAFLAAAGRHQFLGRLELKRYQLNDDFDVEPYRLYFFARMSEGVCYAAPQADQTMDNGELVVLNLPTGFFDFLKQSTRQAGATAVIVRCANEKECTGKKRRAINLQVDYHATYLRLKRLENCQQKSADNQWFRRMAKFRVNKHALPKYCMEEDLEQNIEQLRNTLKQTGQKLFEKL